MGNRYVGEKYFSTLTAPVVEPGHKVLATHTFLGLYVGCEAQSIEDWAIE